MESFLNVKFNEKSNGIYNTVTKIKLHIKT